MIAGGKLKIGPDKNLYTVLGDNTIMGQHQTDGLSRYYAYDIRNSFGIDFDPVTGDLWGAENGWTKMMGLFSSGHINAI